MTDIVEWLRGEVPHCDDPNNYDKWELRMLEAADEIERLREALRGVISVPDKAALDAARAALGEGKE